MRHQRLHHALLHVRSEGGGDGLHGERGHRGLAVTFEIAAHVAAEMAHEERPAERVHMHVEGRGLHRRRVEDVAIGMGDAVDGAVEQDGEFLRNPHRAVMERLHQIHGKLRREVDRAGDQNIDGHREDDLACTDGAARR